MGHSSTKNSSLTCPTTAPENGKEVYSDLSTLSIHNSDVLHCHACWLGFGLVWVCGSEDMHVCTLLSCSFSFFLFTFFFLPSLTGFLPTVFSFLWNVTTLSSPKVPASPSFGPSPLPSPSPLQLSSTITTPGTGRSPSPSASPFPGNNASRAAQIGENRRQDLLQAMSDRLSVGARSPSPSPLSPFTTHSQHAPSSPSYSPSLRPVTSSSMSTPTGAPSTTPPPSSGTSVPVVSIPRRKKKQKVVQFWKWSGKNDYMVLSEPGFIGLGGGDGKFGLWIHSDLERGHSARCATYENEPLAAASRHPIRGTSVNGHIELAPAKAVPAKATGHELSGPERSASPSESEEFYCQTVEIWSMVL